MASRSVDAGRPLRHEDRAVRVPACRQRTGTGLTGVVVGMPDPGRIVFVRCDRVESDPLGAVVMGRGTVGVVVEGAVVKGDVVSGVVVNGRGTNGVVVEGGDVGRRDCARASAGQAATRSAHSSFGAVARPTWRRCI